MNTPLRFIIALFGNRHAGMLLPLLHSIKESNPEATISLYWEDIDSETILQFSQAFPQLQCIETNFDFSNDITKRISSKTLVWERAARDNESESGWLIFLDADMLVIKELASFLENFTDDAIFTERSGQFPINSGVIAARPSKGTAEFFTSWLNETQNILGTPTLYAQANDKSLPYGGADQMALHRLLNYRGYDPHNRRYAVSLAADSRFHFSSTECSYLNETYSVPITDVTHILHYKGGWRGILFEGGAFTRNRPKSASWDMYVLYIRYFKEAVSKLNATLGTNYKTSDFGFSIPFYINPQTLEERRGLYSCFFLLSWARSFPRRALAYAKERLFR
jgi:hypothetical protein